MDIQGYWQRIEHLYERDVNTSSSTYNDPPVPGQFRPGDIVHTSGGVKLAFWEYYQRHGNVLTPSERSIVKQAEQASIGKYCVVLERIESSPPTYVVCYLTTFGGMKDPRKLSPQYQWCALAFGQGSNSWPPKFDPIATVPRWTRNAFLITLPVLRDNLQEAYWPGKNRKPWLKNFRTRVPEVHLERVRQAIKDREWLFRTTQLPQRMRDYETRMYAKYGSHTMLQDEEEDDIGLNTTPVHQSATADVDVVESLDSPPSPVIETPRQRVFSPHVLRYWQKRLPVFIPSPKLEDDLWYLDERHRIPTGAGWCSHLGHLLSLPLAGAPYESLPVDDTALVASVLGPHIPFQPRYPHFNVAPGSDLPIAADVRETVKRFAARSRVQQPGLEVLSADVSEDSLSVAEVIRLAKEEERKRQHLQDWINASGFDLLDYEIPVVNPKNQISVILKERARQDWLEAKKKERAARAVHMEAMKRAREVAAEREAAKRAAVETQAGKDAAFWDPGTDLFSGLGLNLSLGDDSGKAAELQRIAKEAFRREMELLRRAPKRTRVEDRQGKDKVVAKLPPRQPQNVRFAMVKYESPPAVPHKWLGAKLAKHPAQQSSVNAGGAGFLFGPSWVHGPAPYASYVVLAYDPPDEFQFRCKRLWKRAKAEQNRTKTAEPTKPTQRPKAPPPKPPAPAPTSTPPPRPTRPAHWKPLVPDPKLAKLYDLHKKNGVKPPVFPTAANIMSAFKGKGKKPKGKSKMHTLATAWRRCPRFPFVP